MTNVVAVTKYKEIIITNGNVTYKLYTSHCQELLKQYVI